MRHTVKSLNDRMGPKGMIPSFLVFGTLKNLPADWDERPGQDERMEVLRTARDEMQKITAEVRVKETLRWRLPLETSFELNPGKRPGCIAEIVGDVKAHSR